MFNKKICILIFSIFIMLFAINCVNAANYSVTNSTDADTISKMISGDLPIKNGKFIKNGDIVKFKAGNYYGVNLTVNKRIKLTTTKKDLRKAVFIGEGSGTFINVKSKKINVHGLKIKNYGVAIKAKTNKGSFSKLSLSKNGISISGNKNKIYKNSFVKSGINVNGKYNKIYSNNVKSGSITISGYKNTFEKNLERGEFVTVSGNKNLIINNKIYSSGLYIQGKSNKVYKNKVSKADTSCIGVYGSKNLIYYNTVSKADTGIDVNDKGHVLKGNKISNCKYGIVYQFKSVVIKNNIFKANKKNIWYNPIVYPY